MCDAKSAQYSKKLCVKVYSKFVSKFYLSNFHSKFILNRHNINVIRFNANTLLNFREGLMNVFARNTSNLTDKNYVPDSTKNNIHFTQNYFFVSSQILMTKFVTNLVWILFMDSFLHS